MMQQSIPVLFRVRVVTRPNEVVCVVGDSDELGNWDPHKAVELCRDHRSKSEIWLKEVRLKSNEIKYRYFTCYIHQPDNEDEELDVMVTRWETNIRPRRFYPFGHAGSSSDYELESGTAIFGRYDGRENIYKGWLTGQTEVQLRLYNNPIIIWKQSHKQQKYQITCKTMDLRYRDICMEMEDEDSNDQILTSRLEQVVKVSVMNDKKIDRDLVVPHEQPQYGMTYQDGDYFIFTAQAFVPEYMGFTFNFYEETHDECNTDTPKHVGFAYILPVNMKDTRNIRTIPIHGLRHKPIGQLTVDYLKIKPLKDKDLNDMSVSYAKHWKERPSLEVGHRGMGVSYHSKECAAVTENTLASLNAAGGHGADYVEFDVQLSSDLHPVIYHDFEVCLTLRGKKHKDELQLFKLPVKSLTLEQLQQLQLDHVTALNKEENDLHREGKEEVDNMPFPTLQTCLEQTDPHIGFNIEIKYPMALMDGSHEQYPFFDQNVYLDRILATVLQYSGKRRIVFSCFEPDICSMIRMKQNKYPVQYLTSGQTYKWPLYKRVITQTTEYAALYCLSQDLMGINVNAEVLVNNLDRVQMVKDLGLVLFVWGEELNDSATIKMFKDNGVHGVIYDRISEFKTSDNVFKMENEAKMHLLESVGVLTNVSGANNGHRLTHSQSADLEYSHATQSKMET